MNQLLVKINLWQIVAGLLERRGERNVARRKPGLEAKDRRQYFVFEYNHAVFIDLFLTMLCMCSQILRNLLMLPEMRVKVIACRH